MNISTNAMKHSRAGLIARASLMVALMAIIGGVGALAQAPATGPKQAVVTVKGMQCPFCAYGIKKHLAKLPGVSKVEVDLAKNQAIVSFALDAQVTDQQIQQAIRKAGFTPDKIEWRSAVKGGQTERVIPIDKRLPIEPAETSRRT